MSRSQAYHQNLVLVTVPPGNITGLYYITIANFSHSTTWKDLKSFVSQVCEVDFCLIYDPTAGFVRVKGLENFEKAYKFLDGNTLHYRCLQADARNRDQSTVVKLPPNDYHAIMLNGPQRGRVVEDPSDPQPAPDTYYAYPTNPDPVDTMGRNSECTSPIQYTTDQTWPSYPAYTTTPQEYPPTTLPYQDLPVAQPFSGTTLYPNPGETYYPGPSGSNTTEGYYPAPPPQEFFDPSSSLTNEFSSLSLSYPRSSDLILLENRKIILLNLDKRRLDQSYISSLLSTFCPPAYSTAIEQIEIPISSRSRENKPKGTAFITFSSAEVAMGAVDCLNGVAFGGRGLTARLAEGIPAGRDGKKNRGVMEEQKRERRRERRGGGGDGGGERKEEGAPVVVDGSRGRPVIVNGSRRERGGRA
ncbi:uncharacterized protein QC763_706865 [Podospora pseudopauciseta]|uniref:RRM domain-containing protein n=1 Tax=Podospora pseudopauciseta TaxID=2093780 RepID=A0ABR0H0Z0_9PEZI|nr:hypothetical protein QC763_706865 [Podospora pseudopauciseta]